MIQEYIKTEQDFIYLLLKNKSLVEDWVSSPLKETYFDVSFTHIIKAILTAFEQGCLLTKNSFKIYADTYIHSKKDRIAQEYLYNQICLLNVKTDDYPFLKQKIIESYVSRKSTDILKDLPNLKQKQGSRSAIDQIADSLKSLVSDVEVERNIFYDSVDVCGEDYLIEAQSDKPQKPIIKCHIKEIDYTMKTGFYPSGLTLFSADVGKGKSTIMMNVGLNIYKYEKKNILFVPLEMPRSMYIRKMLSRETKISFDKLAHKNQMTAAEWDRVQDVVKSWKESDHKMYIMETFDQRAKVSTIKAEIKKHIERFQPDIVVVDYIANLVPDHSRQGRNDLEIGDMLKELQHMGKEKALCENGFHIISAAQVGRTALTRVRKTSSDKISFNSEDLRGSQEYSADASASYVIMPDPAQPTERLFIYCIKSRYGPTTMPDGGFRGVLDQQLEFALIQSLDYEISAHGEQEVLSKISADVLDDSMDVSPASSQSDDPFDKPVAVMEKPKTVKKKTGDAFFEDL